jgi:hypothetical protein
MDEQDVHTNLEPAQAPHVNQFSLSPAPTDRLTSDCFFFENQALWYGQKQ